MGAYILLIGLFHIPYFQREACRVASAELSQYLQTKVRVEGIDVGLLNRLVLNGLYVEDQQKELLLKASLVSGKIEVMPLLFDGKIRISSIQLFNFHANVYKDTPEGKTNLQFLIDKFTSKKPKKKTPLDLRFNSVLIRGGNADFNLRYKPYTPGKFNPSHVKLQDLTANLSVKVLTNDSLNVYIRQLSLKEGCGLSLQKMSGKFTANKTMAQLTRLKIHLPGSKISIPAASFGYDLSQGKDFLKTLSFKAGIEDSHVTPADIRYVVPALSAFDDPLFLSLSASGNLRQIAVPRLKIHTENHDIDILLSGRVNLRPQPSVTADIRTCTLTSTGIRFLWNELSPKKKDLPPIVSRLGNISYQGKLRFRKPALSVAGKLHTGLGTIDARMDMTLKKAFKGDIQTKGFLLGRLLDNQKLNHIAFSLHTQGNMDKGKLTAVSLKGDISDFDFNQYRYHHVNVDGQYRHGGFAGQLRLNDHNGNLFVKGNFNMARKIPVFNIEAQLKGFNPHALRLTPKMKDTRFEAKLAANFQGNSINNLDGLIQLEDFKVVTSQQTFQMGNTWLKGEKQNGKRIVTLHSPYLKAIVRGNYTYATLPASLMRIAQENLPTLLKGRKLPHTSNDFDFTLTVDSLTPLRELLHKDIRLHQPLTLKGYVDDRQRKMRMEGHIPSFEYNGGRFETGRILCDNEGGQLHLSAQLGKYFKGTSLVSFSTDIKAHDDHLDTSLRWGNDKATTYSGELNSTIHFLKEEGKDMATTVRIKPSEVIIEDSVWNIHPALVRIEKKHIEVEDFLFEHGDQHIGINGTLSPRSEDSLTVDLKRVNLQYIFDIVNFHTVDFTGYATGKAYVKNVFSGKPDAYTNLHVSDFHFNRAYMGEMDVFSKWDRSLQGVYLDAHIKEGDISTTTVKGYVSPPRKYLDLLVTANNSNGAFIQEYTDGIFSDVAGRIRGYVRVYGQLRKVNMEGDARADMQMKVDVLNTTYRMKNQHIQLRPNIVEFMNDTIQDERGHKGLVQGALHHNFLHDLTYDFRISAADLMCYNQKEADTLPFCGTINGSGVVNIDGKAGQLNVNLNFTPTRGTEFVYITGKTGAASAADNNFITFRDKTPRREQPWIEEQNSTIQEEMPAGAPDIHMNFVMHITPDAHLKVIIDPLSGDYITATGTGTLEASWYNKGKFQMYGTYQIDHGNYKFTLQQVIHKDFAVAKGGQVHFTGDPFNAEMDLQGIYTVPSVSLNDLIPGMSFKQNNVRVNCLMNLSGPIQKPEIKFDLALPSVSEEEQELVHSAISTEEQMNMQILYLLGVGRFYTYDYVNANTNQSQSAMNSLLSSTLSGQLNQFLSRSLNLHNWNFGANLATGDRGWSDMDIEGILSGSLLNNRLLINGNFGYKENSLNTLNNSNFIGDFDVQWLINRSGTVSLKAYNKSNDRYFSRSTLYTQGIGIMLQREFDSWRQLWIFNRKKKQKQTGN